jgi:hypothetical protein
MKLSILNPFSKIDIIIQPIAPPINANPKKTMKDNNGTRTNVDLVIRGKSISISFSKLNNWN